MAAEPQISKIERLIERSDASRLFLTEHVQTLRYRADIPARVRGLFNSHPSLWFGGSLLLGWLFTAMLRRRKPTPKPQSARRKGVLGFALATVTSLAKPALKSMLIAEFRKRMLSPADKKNATASPRQFIL